MPAFFGSDMTVQTGNLVIARMNLMRISNRLIRLVALIATHAASFSNDRVCRENKNSQNDRQNENLFQHGFSQPRLL